MEVTNHVNLKHFVKVIAEIKNQVITNCCQTYSSQDNDSFIEVNLRNATL